MSDSTEKKLTGPLIVLMLILGFGTLGGIATEITNVSRAYETLFSQYPALRTAVLTYQCVLFGSACAACCTIWLLYRRVPGTLLIAKRCFVLTLMLRIGAFWMFDWLASLPNAGAQAISSQVRATLGLVAFGAAWYLWLCSRIRG